MKAAVDAGASRTAGWLAAAVICLGVVLAYASSLSGPFVFDDIPSIAENSTIRSLATAWRPPAEHGETVGGRPLVNVTLALNLAAGGLQVRGYHAVNLSIHLAAALLLFGVVRRTLLQPSLRDRWSPVAVLAAASVALIWAVHPLQSAAVTYVVQRAESLCGLAYLATLYAFIRGVTPGLEPRRRRSWHALAGLTCLAGMGCKEVMVTAPLVVLLYDRCFLAESWNDVKRRWPVHVMLAATWGLLAALVISTRARAGSAGFGTGVEWTSYARTQLWAVPYYLRLCLWPTPLVFDYGTTLVGRWSAVWAQTAGMLVLVAATSWALVQRPRLGWVGAAFLLALAPSSSVLPIATQTIAEHRMYLPSAAVVGLVVLGLFRIAGPKAVVVAALVAVAAVGATRQRNRDYASAQTLWADTVAKRPENARAHLNLGVELAARGQVPVALEHFRVASALAPDDSDVRNNLANALNATGHGDEALEHYAAAVRLGPRNAKARHNYGNALALRSRPAEALEQLTEAVRIAPTAAATADLGRVLAQIGELARAEEAYRTALSLDPALLAARLGLGEVLARRGQATQAESVFREVVQQHPDSVAAHIDLGRLLLLSRRAALAVEEFRAALRLGSNTADVHANLGAALAISGQLLEGERELEVAVQLEPENAFARQTLERVRRARLKQP